MSLEAVERVREVVGGMEELVLVTLERVYGFFLLNFLRLLGLWLI